MRDELLERLLQSAVDGREPAPTFETELKVDLIDALTVERRESLAVTRRDGVAERGARATSRISTREPRDRIRFWLAVGAAAVMAIVGLAAYRGAGRDVEPVDAPFSGDASCAELLASTFEPRLLVDLQGEELVAALEDWSDGITQLVARADGSIEPAATEALLNAKIVADIHAGDLDAVLGDPALLEPSTPLLTRLDHLLGAAVDADPQLEMCRR